MEEKLVLNTSAYASFFTAAVVFPGTMLDS
jgi:hypothetical protein